MDHSHSLQHESDVMFVVGGAARQLRAHRCVLEVRCPTVFAVNVKVDILSKDFIGASLPSLICFRKNLSSGV